MGEKKSEEWAKSRKGLDRKSNRTRQKSKRGDIQKWDQTESPEIPDRGRHQKCPASLRGGLKLSPKVIAKQHSYLLVSADDIYNDFHT